MKIGELAFLAHTPVETIRYYEREGLLPAPVRTESNYRVYAMRDVERLSFIRRCRGMEMALDEIRVLLRLRDAPSERCDEVDALLDKHLGHVTERLRELRQLEQQLRRLRGNCAGGKDARHCGILEGLADAGSDGDAAVRGVHVQGTHSGRPRARHH